MELPVSHRESFHRTSDILPAVFVNFISYPLPENNSAGAGLAGGANNQSGALGLGQQASTGLTLFNSFWSYMMPLWGAYLADAIWGRFKTIHYAIYVAMLGHVIIIIAALPSVITNPNGAIGAFAIGLVSAHHCMTDLSRPRLINHAEPLANCNRSSSASELAGSKSMSPR